MRLSRRIESTISIGPDGFFLTGKLVGRGDPADGVVQADEIVVVDVPSGQAFRLGSTTIVLPA